MFLTNTAMFIVGLHLSRCLRLALFRRWTV